MPTRINVLLTGSVVVYDDGINWNFVFVTDNDHRFVISDVAGAHPDQTIRLAGKDRVLRLTAGRVNDQRRSYTDNARKYGLNMSAAYLHDVDPGTGKSNLYRTH